jgi:hypothetical protein
VIQPPIVGPRDGASTATRPYSAKAWPRFFWFKRIRHDGLSHWLEAASPDALKDACKKQDRESRRDTAKKTCRGEDGNTKQKEILAADNARCPCTDREDDGVRDQIAGENPCSLTGAGAEIAGNVRQRNICDGGIENLHKGRQRDRCRDQPRVYLWFPPLAVTSFYCHARPFCYRHLRMAMPVHAVGLFFALVSTCRIPATNLLGPSSNVEDANASHSPRLPAMETMGMRDQDARIKLVRRSLSPAGAEWHRRTRSKSPD